MDCRVKLPGAGKFHNLPAPGGFNNVPAPGPFKLTQGARLMLTTYGKDKAGTAIYHVDKALAEFGVTVDEHSDVPPPETPTQIN